MPSIRLAELHPIIVHFPIALLLTSVTLDFLAIFLHRSYLIYGATWLLGFGVIGAFLAGVTGTVSARVANTSSVGSILSLHQKLGFATGFLFAVLLLVRLIWLTPRIMAGLGMSQATVLRAGNLLQGVVPGVTPQRLAPVWVGLYLFVSVVACVLLGLTGYLGGAMVYDHGVGTPLSLVLTLRPQ